MAIVTIHGRITDPKAAEPGVLHLELRRSEGGRTETIAAVDTTVDGAFTLEVEDSRLVLGQGRRAASLELQVLRDGAVVTLGGPWQGREINH